MSDTEAIQRLKSMRPKPDDVVNIGKSVRLEFYEDRRGNLRMSIWARPSIGVAIATSGGPDVDSV